jgi:PAS domain S-box-containing protein
MSTTLEPLAAPELVTSPLPASGAGPATLGAQRRRQEALVALGRRAIAPPDVTLLVQDAAALIAETLDVEQYGVAELQDDQRLRVRVWALGDAGAARDERALHETFVSTACGESLAGFALGTAETLSVADLAVERRFADRWLLDQQVGAGVAVPLRLLDEAYGALLALSPRPRRFTPDDVLFAETIGHMVSTTIGRDRALKTLEQERTFTRTVLETVEALVMVLHPSGRIARVNRTFERTVGFRADEVRERPIWNFLLAPEEVAAVQAMLRRSAREIEPVEHESFVVTQPGERRRIRWSYATLNRAAGEGATIVATGIDVTAQRNAEARWQQLQAAADSPTPESADSLTSLTADMPLPPTRRDESFPLARDANSSPFHPLPPSPQSERRKRPRRMFSYFQRIAPYQGKKLPPPALFREVRCCDISAGGFSFVSARPPDHTDYVVALGAAPVVIHLSVRVAHVTPKRIDDRDVYLVGCTYLERVDY